MKKTYTIIMLATMSSQLICANPVNDADKIKALEEKCSVLQQEQVELNHSLRKLTDKQIESERKIRFLDDENMKQESVIDSLQKTCKLLEVAQSTNKKNINGRIDATDNNVRANQDMLQVRTSWGIIVVILFLITITSIAYLLSKRIKSGKSTIGEVLKAQEALQAAQTRMQEESVKLESQLLEITQKQFDVLHSPSNKTSGEPDHTLVVKLANQIARIETNLSKMDKSVKGYKLLVKAKDNMINNVRAYGYEIISLLGQEYNDGMQFKTRFVPDESLPEGKRIITGMITMQVNYNGKMIQPAEIVVSQNI